MRACVHVHTHTLPAGFIAGVKLPVSTRVRVDRAATCYADCMYCGPISVYVRTVTTEEL